MNDSRRNFMKKAAATTIAVSALSHGSKIFAEPVLIDGIDKLQNDKGEYFLAPLPYQTDALEPYMDAETLNLHHNFHHGGAVKGLNKDIVKIKEALDKNDLDTVDYWIKKSAYHGSSHILHTIFWTNLKKGGGEPKGELLKLIEKQYKSFDKFKGLISQVSNNVDGSGWGVVAYNPFTQQLNVLQCENHEKLIQWGAIPILIIDVWEHAYYLKYKNRRPEFVSALFNIIDWDNVAVRLNNAQKFG